MSQFNILGKLFYKRLALLLFCRSKLFLVISVLVLVAMLSQLKKLTIDSSTEGFLAKDAQKIVVYHDFIDQFERDEVILVTIQTDKLFTLDFLTRLNEFHNDLYQQFDAAQEVESLVNARNVYGADDELFISDLLEDMPTTPEQVEAIKATAVANPLYVNRYFSKDLQLTTLFVRLKTAEFDLAQIQSIVDDFKATNSDVLEQVYLAGSPIIAEQVKANIKLDMRRFTMLTLVLVLILLAVIFRQAKMVLLPLLVVIPTLLMTFAMLAITKQPIQTPLTILPSFILALGVADAVHFLTAYKRAFAKSASIKRAVVKAMDKTAIPMLLTSLTTAVGLLSFSGAGIVPIANLGIFAAFGVLLAFVVTVVILPLAIKFLKVKPKVREAKTSGRYEAFVGRLVPMVTQKAKAIVLATSALMVFAFYSIAQLEFAHNPLKWFDEQTPVRQATELMGDKMSGVIPVELLINTGVANGAKSAQFLHALEGFVLELRELGEKQQQNPNEIQTIGKVIAVTDILKEVNLALHDDNQAFYRVPYNDEQIAQEFLLIEMGNGERLFQLIDSDYQTARVTVMVPWLNATDFPALEAQIMQSYKKHLSSVSNIEMTGIIAILMQTMNEVIHTTAFSYTLAFLLVAVMMVLLLRNLRFGLVAMVPNVFPVAMILAAMYWFNIPLDMFTLLVGTIAIGLAVDDTIHFMHNFKAEREKGATTEQAITNTLLGAGRAMTITTTALVIGFMVFTLSSMSNLQYFGMLTAACILLALVADFIVAPALMVLMNKGKNTIESQSANKTTTNWKRNLGATAVVLLAVQWWSLDCADLPLAQCVLPQKTYQQIAKKEPLPAPSIVTQGKDGVVPCIACHGANGEGNWDLAYPRLAGLNADYIKKQLIDFSRNRLDVGVNMDPIARDYRKTPRIYKDLTIFTPGIRYEALMSDLAKNLTDQEMTEIAEYYSRLPFKTTPIAVDFQTLERGRDIAVRGKPEYMLPRCSSCHGPEGEGFGEHFPPLAGQPPEYLINQINRWQRGERDNDHLSMMKNVSNLLTDGDKANVAAYYSNKSYEVNL